MPSAFRDGRNKFNHDLAQSTQRTHEKIGDSNAENADEANALGKHGKHSSKINEDQIGVDILRPRQAGPSHG